MAVPAHRAPPPRSRLFAADPIDLRVCARLAARRRALRLDAGLLDLVLGLREGTIERLEAGESRIGSAHLYRLAHALEVSIDWFFAEETEAPAAEKGALQAHPLASPGDPDEAAQARRFLAFYDRLPDACVRAEISAIVRALAEKASAPTASGATSPMATTMMPAPVRRGSTPTPTNPAETESAPSAPRRSA